jgi:beta-lactamase class C
MKAASLFPSPLNRRAVLGALGALALPSLAQPASNASAVSAAVEGAFRPLLAAHNVPGLVVGVTLDGQRHFFPYGVASRESGMAATPDTLFELGSLSKCFTATLACHAEAAGRLSLSDSPGKYLPALRGSAIDKASLLHLGTYTAGGLPLQFPDDIQSLAEAMAFYRAFQPTAAPGAVRRYSNPSIGLMGHVAGVAMGSDFTTACEKDLFPGLGLRQTHIRVPAAAMPAYAWGYNKAEQPIRVNPGVFDAEAYGVKSTARDMLRFLEVNMQQGVPAALRAAVAQTQVPRFEVGALVQGLGWEQYEWPAPLGRLRDGNSSAMALEPHPARAVAPDAQAGSTLFNKTGSTNGFGAYAAFIPARRIGIVMLANRNFPNAARVTAAHEVLTALTQ